VLDKNKLKTKDKPRIRQVLAELEEGLPVARAWEVPGEKGAPKSD